MSLRSPLGRVLGLGSAKEGTEHWWSQRISAAALVLLGLWFAVSVARLDAGAYADVIAFIAMPLNSVLLILLAATMAYHSWLGVQVVIEDYIHAPTAKIVLLTLSRFLHVLVAVASIYAILRIGITA
ncbi:MAG: succinate dehydrogenase, hydrophobic membrane anchor protein [Woeseiaceae bacterium]|jgi:succinate dehydrogenase / fumarate reductase membrane anchor subunit|nr:succinate dehydrogenase, hydrophobic membrane anchor protein [Woeseiaceae bacterium]